MAFIMKKDFNKTALYSNLFKGHTTWYFTYVKSEKLAHVLVLLAERSPAPHSPIFERVLEVGVELPNTTLQVVAGELPEEVLLAELFSLLSFIRLLNTRGEINKENALILLQEYEKIIERVTEAKQHLGLLISPEHVAIPSLTEEVPSLSASLGFPSQSLKDIYKGQYKGKVQDPNATNKGQSAHPERLSVILDVIKQNKGISIKGISAVVRDCSEKTIQRELGTLIEKGLVIREGERRWSIYKAAITP